VVRDHSSRKEEDVPVAPASKSASACTKPSPLAAPDTRTTLPARLNSGNRLAVARYADASLLFTTALPVCESSGVCQYRLVSGTGVKGLIRQGDHDNNLNAGLNCTTD